MHSECISFCGWRSAVSLLGEGGEIAVQEVSIVLLQMESAKKRFLATYLSAHLKKINSRSTEC